MTASKPDAHGALSPPSASEARLEPVSGVEERRKAGSSTPERLQRAGGDVPRGRFRRGRSTPRGVRWFGVSSFWGHLRHFVASAVATEDIDSRDWMTPDDPHELCRRIAGHLRRGQAPSEAGKKALTLVEQIDRDLWIDYVSDTGDDVEVSGAVARLLAREYLLPDIGSRQRAGDSGREVLAPRGDLLFFGGDTAYPVATAEEIHDRVVVPFNRVLLERYDGRDRVLVGIPGNHDWYDGLDGFARLFRRRPYEQAPAAKGTSCDTLQRSELGRYTEFARRFMLGEHVEKPGTLDLVGYRPVQSASYFALPLAPGLHLYAVDRQLRNMDYRQRQYFESWRLRHPGAHRVIFLPDPPFHFGAENASGRRMVRALGLEEARERALVFSGDIHHYERWREKQSTYVIAGGGGAFLHPAPVSRRLAEREVEWPGPRQCKRLLWGVPWKVASGRSGILPHFVFAALLAPIAVALASQSFVRAGVLSGIAFLAVAVCFALIGGIRRKRGGVLLPVLACLAAGLVLVGPWLGHAAIRGVGAFAPWVEAPSMLVDTVLGTGLVVAWSSVFGSALFGAYLMTLTWLGIENTQAFTALDHPGYKHFLRMRVRRDGSGIDVWCIGAVDPLGPGERPVLVDAFSWSPH